MTPPPVTVIGLGAMGRALSRAFLAAGHRTAVWNRTPGRAQELVAAGAHEARSVTDAVAASPLVIICVLDRAAVEDALRLGGDLTGATIVNLTSGTPDDARAVAQSIVGVGGRVLSGTIMVPTPLVGSPESLVLYSGDPAVYAEHRATLDALGPGELLGEDQGLAAVHDLGMLDIFFNGMAAFLHAAALVSADGITATRFVPYARRMLDLLQHTTEALAADVDRGEHRGDEDNLVMERAFLGHIVKTSAASGIDTTLPAASLAFVEAAITAGHGADGFSRVIDVLRVA